MKAIVAAAALSGLVLAQEQLITPPVDQNISWSDQPEESLIVV